MKRVDATSLIAVAALGACAAGLSLLRWPAPAPSRAEGVERLAAGASVEGRAELAAPIAMPATPTEAVRPLPSPGARVETLARSGDPHQAYSAARLIDRCIRAREAEARREIKSACRDIGATQLRLRLPLLEAAARAGVPGAVTAWTGEGPFGDKTALAQRPDDPLVVEWARQAVAMIRAAAGRDDVAAITQLGWLTVHWDMSDTARLSALLNHPAEWRPREVGADARTHLDRPVE